MTATVNDVGTIPEMHHREAMELAEAEAARLIDVVDGLGADDWSRPTDCTAWDVHALLGHVLGSMESHARPREFVRQFVSATRAAKRSGAPMIDEMTALQVRDQAGLSPDAITRRLRALAPLAVRGRRRVPAAMRAIGFTPGPPFAGKWKLGYLLGPIMTRDAWMHRVDLTRATGTDMVLTPAHDGRIVADVVAEWARRHGQAVTLVLDGPAGGAFAQGVGGDELRLDAVEFCRTVAGRVPGTGLLGQDVPF